MIQQNEKSLHDRPDSELLCEFAEFGQESAFEQILLRHGGMVSAVCRSVLRNPADAEDATQAVFLTLVKRASSLKGHTTLAGWLHRVAWYVATRAARAEANRRRHEEAAAQGWQELPDFQDEIPAELIHDGLASLSRKYQEPLLLHHLEGRSERETAELLNCSVSAVSARLARGRKMLRDRLMKRGVSVSAVGLSTVLAANAAETIPPVLAGSITHMATSVLAGEAVATVASAQAVALSNGALKILLMTKLKTAAIATAACLATGMIASEVVWAAPEQNLPAPQGEAPAGVQPASTWTKLYADEDWYAGSTEKEQVFAGILQAQKEPEAGIMMRAHFYRLNNRLIYPGKKHPELDKLVGQQVEIRGKAYDIELEGQALSEIWPAAIRRVAANGNGTVLTPAGKLNPAPAAPVGTAVPVPQPVSNEPAAPNGGTTAATPAASQDSTPPARRTTPIKIGGKADPRAPRVIVLFENEVDAPKEQARLEKLYGFKSSHVYSMPTFKGFAAIIPAAALEKIRWEPSIKTIEYDGVVGLN